MPRIVSMILMLLMSVAFAAETIAAHKGTYTVAFAREEEKENEGSEQKATEDKLNPHLYTGPMRPLLNLPGKKVLYNQRELPAGYYHQPFLPPDTV